MARALSQVLFTQSNYTTNNQQIIAAPDLLDKWVGGSEKRVRELFAPSQKDKNNLHVIIVDEIDAVFRKRTASNDPGEVARASTTNQILTLLDGMKTLARNVIFIGITNRRELLDEALLRPGRLEVQILIPKPNKEARRDILRIHFRDLRKNGRLSPPLCAAIDGISVAGTQLVPERIHRRRHRRPWSFALRVIQFLRKGPAMPIIDLSHDIYTGGFSGADIAGLVRCAASLALQRAIEMEGNAASLEAFYITLEDVLMALKEVKI